MPIRIERDQSSGGYTPRPRGGGGGGGGSSIFQFLPILIGLFGKRPKLLLLIAIIAGIWYFASGKGCNILNTEGANQQSGGFSLGTLFDEQKYSETEIFEPLADNVRNPLPEAVSLLKYAPPRLNQGQQGSCVAWASAYGARSILESRESGKSPESCRFSPSFLYNQIALEGCQGAYLPEAMKVMKGTGLAPYEDMPYTDNDCSSQPGQMQIRKASDFKIDGYQRLTRGDDPKSVDMLAIKQNLAQGAPVVIGMMVGGTFMQGMLGQDIWLPEEGDYSMPGFGGHAMCVIGYDDYKFAQNMGGFQIMNSWGPEWGNKGVGWVSYSDFDFFVKEAYGLYPMGAADAPTTSVLQAKLGIVLNESDENIAFEKVSNTLHKTSRKMTTGEKFKLQFTNNIPCHVYVFGQETDGSSYVLFPYTEKHSPFCGITGTRLFPKDHSLFPDDKGKEDFFAVVISKTPLDYADFNQKLSKAPGSTYEQKLNSLTGNPTNLQVNTSNTIDVNVDLASTPLSGFVISVMK